MCVWYERVNRSNCRGQASLEWELQAAEIPLKVWCWEPNLGPWPEQNIFFKHWTISPGPQFQALNIVRSVMLLENLTSKMDAFCLTMREQFIFDDKEWKLRVKK